jgi:hypothetical protein
MKEDDHRQLGALAVLRQIEVEPVTGIAGCGIGNIELEGNRLPA